MQVIQALLPMGSSPHTRGAQRGEETADPPPRIIPAYAGSTFGSFARESPVADHPRIRGEHRSPIRRRPATRGSSPHTRGARHFIPGMDLNNGIIPAYAGSTGWTSPGRKRCKDHPRIRGEHRRMTTPPRRRAGSSPHTRGALFLLRYCCPGRADHPRIRGEHRILPHEQTLPGGSSPHTRGAREHAARGQHAGGIIPAYAGSTTIPISIRSTDWDHPRIRGEHDTVFLDRIPLAGSSPHTRGAHGSKRGEAEECRIIPAYAGSTLLT